MLLKLFDCMLFEQMVKEEVLQDSKVINNYNVQVFTIFGFDCLFLGFNIALTSELISQQCMFVALVLGIVCCHTEMPGPKHRTLHPNLSQRAMLSVDVERHTATHFNVLGLTRSRNPPLTFHIGREYFNLNNYMVEFSVKHGRKYIVLSES